MSKTEKRALRLAESPALSPTNEFRRSHAVIIGINDYGNGIPRLRTARADAERLAQIMMETIDIKQPWCWITYPCANAKGERLCPTTKLTSILTF